MRPARRREVDSASGCRSCPSCAAVESRACVGWLVAWRRPRDGNGAPLDQGAVRTASARRLGPDGARPRRLAGHGVAGRPRLRGRLRRRPAPGRRGSARAAGDVAEPLRLPGVLVPVPDAAGPADAGVRRRAGARLQRPQRVRQRLVVSELGHYPSAGCRPPFVFGLACSPAVWPCTPVGPHAAPAPGAGRDRVRRTVRRRYRWISCRTTSARSWQWFVGPGDVVPAGLAFAVFTTANLARGPSTTKPGTASGSPTPTGRRALIPRHLKRMKASDALRTGPRGRRRDASYRSMAALLLWARAPSYRGGGPAGRLLRLVLPGPRPRSRTTRARADTGASPISSGARDPAGGGQGQGRERFAASVPVYVHV